MDLHKSIFCDEIDVTRNVGVRERHRFHFPKGVGPKRCSIHEKTHSI
jgi:hypothetical protein